jgi:hypothetical protein
MEKTKMAVRSLMRGTTMMERLGQGRRSLVFSRKWRLKTSLSLFAYGLAGLP